MEAQWYVLRSYGVGQDRFYFQATHTSYLIASIFYHGTVSNSLPCA